MIKIVKDYVENHVELLKLDATEKTLKIIGISVPIAIISVMIIFFLALFNIGLAFLLGDWLKDYALGFFILSALYFLMIIIAYFLRDKIKNIITDSAIEAFFND